MARCGPDLVDGRGAVRVLAYIKERELHIRRVREDDCRRIWEWANDATARTVSFSRDAIPWDRHVEWFAARLRDPGCEFFIALTGQQEPIGQVRFDVSGSEAVISVSLAPGFRGKGYGAMVIRKASGELLDRGRVDAIHAYMQPTNEASRRAFARAGYALSEPTVISGQTADHMVLLK
jgi:RimJ/RimL family protein N-acetyltransferase